MDFRKLYDYLLQYEDNRGELREVFENEVAKMLADLLNTRVSSINKKDIRELRGDKIGIKYWLNDNSKLEIRYYWTPEKQRGVDLLIYGNTYSFLI